MKCILLNVVLALAILASVATCADERGGRKRAATELSDLTEAHAVELAQVRKQAFTDAVALTARAETQRASEGDAWDKGFALGSARCGL